MGTGTVALMPTRWETRQNNGGYYYYHAIVPPAAEPTTHQSNNDGKGGHDCNETATGTHWGSVSRSSAMPNNKHHFNVVSCPALLRLRQPHVCEVPSIASSTSIV